MQEHTHKLEDHILQFYYGHTYQFCHGHHFATYHTFVRVCVQCTLFWFGRNDKQNGILLTNRLRYTKLKSIKIQGEATLKKAS